MTAKLRLAAVGDSGALAPVARVTRVLEPRLHPGASAVVVTIEPFCPMGEPLASIRGKLAAGDVDVALCPASRLPMTVPAEIEVAAVMRCRDARYQFVSWKHLDLSLMPRGSSVVVCDASSRAQVLHRYPSLRVDLAPPNDAVVAGLRHGVWDAACVPAEAIESDPEASSHASPIPTDELIPRVGQGIVAVLLRTSEGRLRDPLRGLNDPAVEHCLHVERAFLARVSETTGATATARATQHEGMIELTGLLADERGLWLVVDQARAPSRFGETIALEIADACRKTATGRAATARRPLSGERIVRFSAKGNR